ncbi:MAG: YggT family protein [Polyangiaceae bacterium]|nr:YggT family protein [Polyangiaceae bacterium]
MIRTLIDLYSAVVFAAVVVSWIRVSPANPAVQLLHKLTEPVLAPIRKVLPSGGGLDFSPMVLLIGLRLLSRLF